MFLVLDKIMELALSEAAEDVVIRVRGCHVWLVVFVEAGEVRSARGNMMDPAT